MIRSAHVGAFMSPRNRSFEQPEAARAALRRIGVEAGAALRAERVARHLTLREVASRAGIAASTLHRLEAGDLATLESYADVAVGLGGRPSLAFEFTRSGRSAGRRRDEDFVHSAMGELEAAHFRGHGFPLAIDEPYQHYQFAGRADFVAWDLDRRALLHVENRTQFPNLQDVAGSFNAKRAYLPAILAERLLPRGAWQSVVHAIVALWSSEVLHTARLRTSTFTAICPGDLKLFDDWWTGSPPDGPGGSVFVLLDPAMSVGRGRRYVGIEAVGRVRGRYRDYAEAASLLRR
jgi:transcriptional regulator with XRE-family HTH domain